MSQEASLPGSDPNFDPYDFTLPERKENDFTDVTVWTGGTIGSTKTGSKHGKRYRKPGLNGRQFNARLPKDFRETHNIDWINPFPGEGKGIDSIENITNIMLRYGHVQHLILNDPKYVKARKQVTHGTATLAHTSAYLALALQNLPCPISVTGAQIPPHETQTDAFHNYDLAVRTSDIDIHEVLVAFGTRIVRGIAAQKSEGVAKEHAFSSPHQSYVADLIGQTLEFIKLNRKLAFENIASPNPQPMKYYPGLEGLIHPIEFTPNLADRGGYFKKLLDPSEHDAIIIKGYASGDVSTRVADIIEEATEKIAIIITPSSDTHGIQEATYAGSAVIGHPSAIYFPGPSHVALLKFQWLFAQGKKLGLTYPALKDWIVDRYQLNFVGETGQQDVLAPGVSEFFLRSKDPVSWFKTKTYGTLLFSLRNRWLRKRAGEWAESGQLEQDKVADWIEQRSRLEVPYEYINDSMVSANGAVNGDNSSLDLLRAYYDSPLLCGSAEGPIGKESGGYELPTRLKTSVLLYLESKGAASDKKLPKV